MSSTSSPANRSPAVNFERCRFDFIVAMGSLDTVGGRPWADLKDREVVPGSTWGDDQIIVPTEYLPPGHLRLDCMNRLDPSLGGLLNAGDSPRDARLEEAVRRCLLALYLPRKTAQKGTRVYKPSSWISTSRHMLAMARWTVENHPSADGFLFAHLGHDQLKALVREFQRGKSTGAVYLRVLNFLADAGERGVLTDFPRMAGVFDTADDANEISYAGLEVPKPTFTSEKRSWQPFPDDFVSALIGRALWLQRNLADQIIDCWAKLLTLSREVHDVAACLEMSKEIVLNYQWKDEDGRRLTSLPFAVTMRGRTSATWPPEDPRDVAQWVTILQGLNVHLLAFCTGARRSEIGSGSDTSLKLNDDGTASFEAVTFKMVRQSGGQVREWPLPAAGAEALRIQEKLAQVVRPPGKNHLWVNINREKAGEPLILLAGACLNTVRYLGLDQEARSDREKQEKLTRRVGHADAQKAEQAHLHRWRHTVARLVGLTVDGAPLVLLDLFGHHNLEMTLGYMRSDPNLLKAAERVARETRALMAKDAVREVMEGTSSGPASEALRARFNSLAAGGAYGEYGDGRPLQDPNRMRPGQSVGFSSADEYMEALSLRGKDWQLVRQGVICTKGPDQSGPCTHGGPGRDAGNCRTTCLHRLETAAAKEQCRESLDALLIAHAAATTEGADMLIANLEKQIWANLNRWDDIRSSLLESSDIARRIWKGARP